MNPRWTGLAKFSSVFLRLALGISFLSAVADRFGLWGVYRQPNVSRGNYARFVDYTAKLNWFLPAAMIPALAIIATAAESLFGLLLERSFKTDVNFSNTLLDRIEPVEILVELVFHFLDPVEFNLSLRDFGILITLF
jgi:hypothetical protein